MALSIIRADSKGMYRLIAEQDLYLDESQTKIIVVKDGEEVPKEAAFVLAGKGGTIPTRYADMLRALEVQPEVKYEVKVEPKPVEAEPEPEVISKPKPSKPKLTEEKPAE